MARLSLLVLVCAVGLIAARATLNTLVALPRIVAQAEETRGW